MLYSSPLHAYLSAQQAMYSQNFEAYIFGCVSVNAVELVTQIL